MSDPKQGDRRLFARAVPRGLTPDQLRASLSEASGGPTNADRNGNFRFAVRQNEFGEKFALTEDAAVRYETSIVQALELMNGNATTMAASARQFGQSHLLSAVMESPFMSRAKESRRCFWRR